MAGCEPSHEAVQGMANTAKSPLPTSPAGSTPPSKGVKSPGGSRRGGKRRESGVSGSSSMTAATPNPPSPVELTKVSSPGSTPSPTLPSDGTKANGPVLAAAARGSEDNAVTARLAKTKMCYFFERGKCASLSCRYAHSASELRHQPNLMKTKLCKMWGQEGKCADGENCIYAHGEVELRVTEGIYKTQMCHFYLRGRCLKGERCNHAHGVEDLRRPPVSAEAAEAAACTPSRPTTSTAASELVLGAPPLSDAGTYVDGSGPGLRHPLSPLRLDDLLTDTVNASTGSKFMTPGNVATPGSMAGFCSPDAMRTPVDVPWNMGGFGASPGGLNGGLSLPPPLPANPAAMWSYATAISSPVTPMPCLQAMTPLGPESALPHGANMLPAAGSWEGPAGSTEELGPEVSCDLEKRLASLDTVVRDLAAEVRGLSAPGGEQGNRRIHR
eukprot:CAMPEP_0170605466 /NCGR_PEP_ID=MMETSP0224-20130122/19988_1 /TAXON_ID=285029 /ORGANISM="Togula jolla, Strain CCCM 725" /LENGTH=441 /DNA_ID=CAMNT_0010930471 /DNA_START=46 /DNA_END=1368 /DNA_ORIENTATION=+